MMKKLPKFIVVDENALLDAFGECFKGNSEVLNAIVPLLESATIGRSPITLRFSVDTKAVKLFIVGDNDG